MDNFIQEGELFCSFCGLLVAQVVDFSAFLLHWMYVGSLRYSTFLYIFSTRFLCLTWQGYQIVKAYSSPDLTIETKAINLFSTAGHLLMFLSSNPSF